MDIYSYALLLSRIKKLEEGGTSGGDADGIKPITEAPTADNPDDDLKIVVLENEPLEKYNGYLYLCKNSLIKFYVYHTNIWDITTTYTFYANEGMTWQDWVNSDFNCYFDEHGNLVKKYWKYSAEETGYGNLFHNLTGSDAWLSIQNNIFFIDTNLMGSDNKDTEKNNKVQDNATYRVHYNHAL